MSINTDKEIGKLWLGTTQIGKAYFGQSLVYTAQTQFYPDTQPIKHYSKGAITLENFTVTRPAYREAYAVYYIPVDLSDCDVLAVKGVLCGYVAISLTDVLPAASAKGASNMVFSKHPCVWRQAMKSTGKDTMDIDATVDVKNLSGVHYLVAAIYGSNITLPQSYVAITQVTGQ